MLFIDKAIDNIYNRLQIKHYDVFIDQVLMFSLTKSRCFVKLNYGHIDAENIFMNYDDIVSIIVSLIVNMSCGLADTLCS